MCIREGAAVSTPSAGANKGLKTPTLCKWRTQKVDRPMEAICGDRGDMVIFLPSQTLEGPPHLALPAASGAQVCLHSAFQCFHLLLIMLWAELTGKKHCITLAPIPLAVVAFPQPQNHSIISAIYGIFHNLIAVSFPPFSSLLNSMRVLHGGGFTCSP